MFFEVWETNYSYMKLRHETQKLQKTKFHSISFNKNVKWSISKIVVMMSIMNPTPSSHKPNSNYHHWNLVWQLFEGFFFSKLNLVWDFLLLILLK
jgi:hypothetical protein